MATALEKQKTSPSTLRELHKKFGGEKQQDIPFLVRLFENPDSPLPFPGQICLLDHDYLHLLLGLGVSEIEEAFIVGFTMGNDPKTQNWHIKVLKFAANHLYPQPYRFNQSHEIVFDSGFWHGRQLQVKELNKIGLSQYLDCQLGALRQKFGIDVDVIKLGLNQSHRK